MNLGSSPADGRRRSNAPGKGDIHDLTNACPRGQTYRHGIDSPTLFTGSSPHKLWNFLLISRCSVASFSVCASDILVSLSTFCEFFAIDPVTAGTSILTAVRKGLHPGAIVFPQEPYEVDDKDKDEEESSSP